MHEITRIRYKDTKKVPEMPKVKQNTVEKSGTTFAERKDNYFPFHRKVEVPQQVEQSRQVEGERQSTICTSIVSDQAAQVCDNVSSMVSHIWEKRSALLLGGMLALAGGLGADAHLQRGGTALGLLDSSNATGLPPALDWRPANRTALPEFDPSRIPPGFTDYLRKIGASESLIRKIERQNARRQLSEQESSEPKRRQLDNAPAPFHSNPPETVENSIQLPNVTRPEFVPPKPPSDLLRHMQKAGTTEHLLEQAKNPPARKLQDWTIPPNSLGCLSSIDDSIITSKTVPVYVNGKLLGKQEEISISSKVKNECPKDVDNVQFHVKATAECGGQKVPDVMWDYQATPPLLHPTETADGGRADAGPPRVFQCQKRNSRGIILAIYPPSSLWVALMADGVMLDGRKKRPVHPKTYKKTKLLTCDDPCSDTPPSVDCIKQCTTTVSSDKSPCLDVSISDVLAKVEPVSGLEASSRQVHLDYLLNVQNNCPGTINNVTYQIGIDGECPWPSVFYLGLGHYDQVFSADPSSVAPGDSAGVKAGQDTSINASCGAPSGANYTFQPSYLSVDIYASGMDPITNSQIHSQKKIFQILGDSESPTYCGQQCPQNHTSSASRRLGNASKWRARHVLLRTGIPLAAYALAGRFR